MLKAWLEKILCLLLCALLLSCNGKSIEEEFFDWDNFSYEKMERLPIR